MTRRDISEWLMEWMTMRPPDRPMLSLSVLADQAPFAVHLSTIDNELRALVKRGFITRRTGTVSKDRGHAAIRIVNTGKILKTKDCPFEPP